MPNGGFAAGPGHGDVLSYRVNRAGAPGGLTIILNAGPANAGAKYSMFGSSSGRAFGQGPFFGLNSDALSNWVLLNNVEPWGASLDANGFYRFGLAPGSLPPGVQVDLIAALQDAVTGALIGRTLVLEYDS